MTDSNAEKRKHHRVDYHQPSTFRVLVFNGSQFKILSQKDFTGELINLSVSGVCLSCPIALQLDSLIGLRFEIPNATITVKGKVAWSVPDGNLFKVGIEFENLEPEQFIRIDQFINENN